jgi:hypothetical protein
MKKRNNYKVIIGRDLPLDLPQLGIEGIASRVDSGAYRSAIHARHIVEKDGELHYELLGGHPVYGKMAVKCTTKKYSTVQVENSFGHKQNRYQVELRVKVGPKIFTAPFSLADRGKKKYPVLLGRILLNDRFIVDTSVSNISRAELKKLGIEMPADEEQEYS